MKSQQKNKATNKRVYEKPSLRIIELETHQVLILGCKLAAGGQAPLNVVNCVDSGCSTAGS